MKNDQRMVYTYFCMSIPYIGIFVDGAEQWSKKMKLNSPRFTTVEKDFYSQLRLSHKLFEKSYNEYEELLMSEFDKSDNYFASNCSFLEKVIGYHNVGTDSCNGEFCGNTLLYSMYIPLEIFGNCDVGKMVNELSVVAGKLAVFFECTTFPVFRYRCDLLEKSKDYHFYNSSPMRMNDSLGQVLFSILCSINYAVEFVENCFFEEIPQKLKFAYLQYYYLCDFIHELNNIKQMDFYIDNSYYNKDFRNCLAHYGLGQYLTEDEIFTGDILKGLTFKAFGKDYISVKRDINETLKNLTEQIKGKIFRE